MTLSFDVSLAFSERETNHLRPKTLSAREGGIKELREGLLVAPQTTPKDGTPSNAPSASFKSLAQRLRRSLIYTLLGLHLWTIEALAIDPSLNSSLSAQGGTKVASMAPVAAGDWPTWQGKIPLEELIHARAQIDDLRQKLTDNIATYREVAQDLAKLEKEYAILFKQYLSAFEKWERTLTTVEEDQDMRIFDEEVHRLIALLREFLDARLQAIDKIIQANAVSALSNSKFTIPKQVVAGEDHQVGVLAVNEGNAPEPVELITVYSLLDPVTGKLKEDTTFESSRVTVPGKSSRSLGTRYEGIAEGLYGVAAFLIDSDRIPPRDERFGISLADSTAPWVHAKAFGELLVLPRGTTIGAGSVEGILKTNLDSLTVPIDSSSRYILLNTLNQATLRVEGKYVGPIPIPIGTEWTFPGQTDPNTNLRKTYSATPDSSKGPTVVPGRPGQTFVSELNLQKAKITRYTVDTKGTKDESDDVSLGDTVTVPSIPAGIYANLSLQFLLNDIPLLPDTTGDKKSDPWNYGKLLQVVQSASDLIQMGSFTTVDLSPVDSLIGEDGVISQEALKQATLRVRPYYQGSVEAIVDVEATFVGQRNSEDFAYLYSLVKPVAVSPTNRQPDVLFDLAKDRITRYQGKFNPLTQDYDKLPGSATPVDSLPSGIYTGLTAQTLLDTIPLLPDRTGDGRSDPISLGHGFTVGLEALGMGSVLTIDLSQISQVIGPNRVITPDSLHRATLKVRPDYLGNIPATVEQTMTIVGQRNDQNEANLFVLSKAVTVSPTNRNPEVHFNLGTDPITRYQGKFNPLTQDYDKLPGSATPVDSLPSGIYTGLTAQTLLDTIPLLPDRTGDGRSDPISLGHGFTVGLEALGMGSVDSVSLAPLSTLIREDPNVPGELILPPDTLRNTVLDIPATLITPISYEARVDGILTFTTERRPNDHVLQYELTIPATLQRPGPFSFHVDVADLIQKGLLVKREVDTRGTPDETDDIVLSSQVVNRFDKVNIANISFQVFLNETSLLPEGRPVPLGIHFTLANGALRPGSFSIVSNNLDELKLAPSPAELNDYPFEFKSLYSIFPLYAPLDSAQAIYEITFSSLTERDSTNRPIRSFVVGGRMGRLLGRGETGVDTLKLAGRRIVEVFQGDSIGVVSEIPPGPYTVRVSLLDTDADPYPNTQENDKLASATRETTLHVGGIEKKGADTLATQGNWIVDGDAIYSNENGSVEYEVDFGPEAIERNLVVYGKNRTSLSQPIGYRFILEVYLDDQPLDLNQDGRTDQVRIPVESGGGVRTGGTALGSLSGVHRIRLKWINDEGANTDLQIEWLLLWRPLAPRGGSPSTASIPAPEIVTFLPGIVSQKATTSSGQSETLREEIKHLQQESDRLGTELEKRLLLLPESQRYILEGMLQHLRSDLSLLEAEKSLLPLAEEMKQKEETLGAVRVEIQNLLDGILTIWKEVIAEQPWSIEEKAYALISLQKWLRGEADLQEAREIAEEKPHQTVAVTMAWFDAQREKETKRYADLRVTGLNMRDNKNVSFDAKLGNLLQIGDAKFSLILGDRPYLVYGGKTERERFIENRDNADDVLKGIKQQIEEVNRQLSHTTDPLETERLKQELNALNQRGRAVRDERDHWHTLYVENVHRSRILDPTDFYYGIQGEYFPHGTGLGIISRVKAYGLPVRIEERIRGYDDRLLGLRVPESDTGKDVRVRLFVPPTRYDFLNNIAWNYKNILEFGYSGAILWDPTLWTLQSHFGQIHVSPIEALRLGGEIGIVRLHTSFEDYVREATLLPGYAPDFYQTIQEALDKTGIPLTTETKQTFKRGSLYYSPVPWGAIGVATDFEKNILARLRGSLSGTQLNIQTLLAQQKPFQFDVHLVHEWKPNLTLQASTGKDPQGWKVSAGVQLGIFGGKKSASSTSPSYSQVRSDVTTPGQSSLGQLDRIRRDPMEVAQGAIPSEIRLRKDEKGITYTGPTPKGFLNQAQKSAAGVIDPIKGQVNQVKGILTPPSPQVSQDPFAKQVESLSQSLSLRTGISSSLFLEKIRLLDPKTRNLVGKISDKLIFPEALQEAVKDHGISAGDLVKLYIVLGHYFEGVNVKTIPLKSNVDLKRLQDPKLDVDVLKDLDMPKDLLEEMMHFLFTPVQLKELENIRQKAIESATIESQV